MIKKTPWVINGYKIFVYATNPILWGQDFGNVVKLANDEIPDSWGSQWIPNP